MSTASKRLASIDLPGVHGSNVVAAGNVCVLVLDPASQQLTPTPSLLAGERVVLTSDGGERLELNVTVVMKPLPDVSGTYLAQPDSQKTANWNNPTVHVYGWSDTYRKIKSVAGLLGLLSSIAAFLTATVALFFLISTQPNPNVATVADKAQTLFEWVRQPVDTLPAGASAAQTDSAVQTLQTRDTQASLCLHAFQGHGAPPTTIPNISCNPVSDQPWWRTTLVGSLITGSVAILTAVIGFINLRNSFGFQKSPAK